MQVKKNLLDTKVARLRLFRKYLIVMRKHKTPLLMLDVVRTHIEHDRRT